jgi:hypothetical protein
MKNDNTWVIIVAVLAFVIVFSGFGMMGFGGMGMMGGYGNPFLCSNIGGIWCYFPIFNFVFMLLFITIIILLVIWIVKKLQGRK